MQSITEFLDNTQKYNKTRPLTHLESCNCNFFCLEFTFKMSEEFQNVRFRLFVQLFRRLKKYQRCYGIPRFVKNCSNILTFKAALTLSVILSQRDRNSLKLICNSVYPCQVDDTFSIGAPWFLAVVKAAAASSSGAVSAERLKEGWGLNEAQQ